MLDMRAPGCYGCATVNDPESDLCKKCAWGSKCKELSKQTLLKIHKEMDVSEYLKKYDIVKKPHCKGEKKIQVSGRRKVKKYTLNEQQQELVSGLSKKTGKVVEQIFKKGINLKLEIKSGNNPFEVEKPQFMRIPVKLLLDGGFTRSALSFALEREFPTWTIETRRSHEGIIMNTLKALDIIEFQDKQYRQKK